ncbi:MAG: MFS transporter [Alphaproteobacteria bacterium]
MTKSLARTVTTSMIGNLFEWYDFALFGYFAAIIGKLFFPSNDPTTELLLSFGTFAAGFIVRPIGGMIFGHIGDQWGRKTALVATILLMAIPTTIIGLLPTYAEWGVWAPVALVIMRMLQGLSMGGNYGGSITFTTEHSKPEQRGLIGSFAVTSCLAGFLLGSITATVFTSYLTEEQLYTWGWRLPFLMGVLICFVGFYMRLKIPESPEYLAEQQAGTVSKAPIKEVFQSYGGTLSLVILTVGLHDVSFYMLLVYMATYLSEVIGLPKDTAFAINTINLLVVCIFTVGSAWLSDKIGRKPVLTAAAILFIIGTIPLLTIVTSTQDPYLILFSQMALAVAVGCYFGPLPALMAEMYPTKIRYSAIAMTTNISGPLFGGITPMLITYLISATGSTMVPAYYLMLIAVISLIALRFLGPPISSSREAPAFA